MATFEPKQFGRFYLLEKLAVGGMAEIYKAKTYGAEGFEKLLAIKRILPHCSADKDFIKMLIDEAKLSVLLSHANIVQVYDLGKVGDDFFISMEYINGINLRDIIYRCRELEKPIPPELVIYIMSEVCKGLDYAHRKTDTNGNPLGIVHRDVSPQNILISFEGEVKIVDFGIAKAAMNISHTMAGILKGKIAYMSPEQALGKKIHYYTDLFSLGLILYECLIGKKVFTGESQFEVLKKIRSTHITAESLPEEIPLPIRPILGQALAYLPKKRYDSAGEMQSDLTRVLYSTYVDFTPQRLAAFVRELFSTELQRQQQEAIARHHREHNTDSVSIALTGVQEDLVQRPGVTHTAIQPPEETSFPSQPSIPMPPERSLSHIEPAPSSRGRRILSILAVMGLLVGTGFGYVKWLHPRLTQPVVQGQLAAARIDSQPDKAQIFLNGKPMGQQTPALIENLQPGAPYTIRLEKAGFQPMESTFTSTATKTARLSLTLEALHGTITVTSTPPGARISIDGTPTGKTTPATIADLALQQPLTVTLTKDDFDAAQQVVTLDDIAPQEIAVTLTPRIKAPIAPIESETKEPLEMGSITGPDLPDKKPAAPPKTTTPVEPPIEPQTAAVGEKGSIRVVTQPAGATVYLNGTRMRGKTPMTLSGLPVGTRQRVRVARTGFTGWSRALTLASAKQVTLSQALKKAATTTPTTSPVKKPPKTSPTKRTADIKREPATAGRGSIRVSTKPKGATVFIDGRSFGRAPLTVRGISSGQRSVRLELKGYGTWSQSVRINTGQEQRISAKLQRQQ